METFGFIGDKGNGEYSPTIGGLLLFGQNMQVYMPHSHIRIIQDQHAEVRTDNIPGMLDWASARMRKIIDDDEYPFAAVEEAIANALVHRDYLDASRGITVNITKKSIEITNPGAYFGGNRVYGYRKDDFPLRRNPWLYQRLFLVDEKKRFLKYGLGINNIKRAFEGIGKVKFINLGRSNAFRVVFPGSQRIGQSHQIRVFLLFIPIVMRIFFFFSDLLSEPFFLFIILFLVIMFLVFSG